MPINTLPVGTHAPDFSGTDQNGQTIRLSDYRGSKLVLYFYPEDDTPLCTQEACNLRDNFAILKQNGYHILGVSPDTVESHQSFSLKYNLPFPLIADPEKIILQAYEAWGEKNMYGKIVVGTRRLTYIIDEEGIIRHVFKKVKSADHAAQILKLGSV
jgi:peroxiredoxin Q/BCP